MENWHQNPSKMFRFSTSYVLVVMLLIAPLNVNIAYINSSNLFPPEGDRGKEIGRSVSPPAGRTPALGASVSSSGMYKYSNPPFSKVVPGKE